MTNELVSYKNIENFFECMKIDNQFVENLNLYIIGEPRDQVVFSMIKDEFVGGSYEGSFLANEMNLKYETYKKINISSVSVDLRNLRETIIEHEDQGHVHYNSSMNFINQIDIMLSKLGDTP
jgi:hypothetical protein